MSAVAANALVCTVIAGSFGTMNESLCARFNFGDANIAERLRYVGLNSPSDHTTAKQLHSRVIQPNLDQIIDDFHASLHKHPIFRELMSGHTQVARWRITQRQYLLSLGQQFDTSQYFEARLQVGSAHQRVGVSLSLYQCFYCLMQTLLIQRIPVEIQATPEAYTNLIQFILKITALDMSLAIETYHSDKVNSLEQSIVSIRGEGEVMRRHLQTDSLTQLYSRAFAIRALKEKLADALAQERSLSVVMADVDHFKSINDNHGHIVGDRILKDVATRMESGARTCDVIGRYGGEEFILVLDDAALDLASVLAERIRTRVAADPIHRGSIDLQVTLSLGVAQARSGDNAESLISRADTALYAAKKAGRNCVRTEPQLGELHACLQKL
ncbi:MAG: diguanylate cyclase [Gammaproteobacteria bacterium]|nr:diguanylate cyclase [Gammaproteobacteria bacterium]